MFAKLMKWEFRQTARVMLPLLGAALLLCGGGLAAQSVLYLLPLGADWLNALSGFLYSMMVLVLFAGILVAYFYAVVRFYRMLGNEGYLVLTLPATPAQHIGAKLVSGSLWVIAAVALTFLLSGVSFVPSSASMEDEFVTVVESFTPGLPLYLAFVLVAVAMLVLSMMWMYFICALGAQWPQQRFGATVVCYLVTSFVMQIVLVAAFGVFVLTAVQSPLGNSLYAAFNRDPAAAFALWMVGLAAVAAAVTAILFFVVRWLISKRLNLA